MQNLLDQNLLRPAQGLMARLFSGWSQKRHFTRPASA